MKACITALALLSFGFSFGQNCFCTKDSMLNEIINCDTIKFDNRACLYWSFNCDSSWLTFESPTHKKEIIFSLDEGLQEYTNRLGYSYVQEFKNSFLIQNRVISGCCSPSDYYLFDKKNGRLKKELGILLFYSQDKKMPFAISLTNSSYDTTTLINGNSLSIYNIDKNKTYFIKLPKGEIERALKKTGEIYPEYLFDEPVLKGSTIFLTYLLEGEKTPKNRHTRTLKIDLKKYR